jgi:hypothetical protein
MMLAVASSEVENSLKVFAEDWHSGLDAAQRMAAEASASIVIDPDAAETTCPACMTTFATGPEFCPDCGLCVG